jgi:hypothetical protein
MFEGNDTRVQRTAQHLPSGLCTSCQAQWGPQADYLNYHQHADPTCAHLHWIPALLHMMLAGPVP